MKTAYFILGPESSGTRMLTQTFLSLGVYGDPQHNQRLDDLVFDNLPDKIVFRRSLPHASKWAPIVDIIGKMQKSGYKVVPVLIMRDKYATIKSQIARGNVDTFEESLANIKFAINYAFEELSKVDLYPIFVNYESFIGNKNVRDNFFRKIDLPSPENFDFYNANEKHDAQKEINMYIASELGIVN